MEYRKLGQSELELSAITYGAFAIGGAMWGGNEKNDSLAAVRASIENGITSLDTAPFYGFGLSEELIGEAIKGLDRTKLQLLTKFGLVWDGSNTGEGEFFFDAGTETRPVPVYRFASKANVIKEAEESLKRLGTDYIDLLQLHWPDATTPVDETMEALELLIRQGKIRAAGVSNFDRSQLQTARQTLGLASNQVAYSMLNRSIENELLPYAAETNTAIIAYSPLERGLLTGKYFKGAALKNEDHRNGYFGQFDQYKVRSLFGLLEEIANNKQISVTQLVLRWTMVQDGVTIVLAGARNAEQAIANAKAAEVMLSAEDLTLIRETLGMLGL